MMQWGTRSWKYKSFHHLRRALSLSAVVNIGVMKVFIVCGLLFCTALGQQPAEPTSQASVQPPAQQPFQPSILELYELLYQHILQLSGGQQQWQTPTLPAVPKEPPATTPPPVPKPACQAPDGTEFTSMLQNATEMMFASMVNDPNTRGAMDYIASPTFQQELAAFRADPSCVELEKYACTDLYIDSNFYCNWLSERVATPAQRLKTKTYTQLPRGGLQGFLDFRPIPQALMTDLTASPGSRTHLPTMRRKINSPSFILMCDRVKDSRPFKIMERNLDFYGVDCQDIMDFVADIADQYIPPPQVG